MMETQKTTATPRSDLGSSCENHIGEHRQGAPPSGDERAWF